MLRPLMWFAIGMWLGWLANGDIARAFWQGLTQ
jgi:hypothetical protein